MKPIHLCAKPTGRVSADMPPLLYPAFVDLLKAANEIEALMVIERVPARLRKPLLFHVERRRTIPESIALALRETIAAMR